MPGIKTPVSFTCPVCGVTFSVEVVISPNRYQGGQVNNPQVIVAECPKCKVVCKKTLLEAQD